MEKLGQELDSRLNRPLDLLALAGTAPHAAFEARKPGEQAGPRRGAEWIHAELREVQAAGRKGVEMRRLQVGGTVTRRVAIALIIVDDQQDVRLSRFCRQSRGTEQCQEDRGNAMA